MKGFVYVWTMCVIALPQIALCQETGWGKDGEKRSDLQPEDATAGPRVMKFLTAADDKVEGRKKRFGIRDLRKMGVGRGELMRAMKALQDEGMVENGMHVEEVAPLLAYKLMQQNPDVGQAFAGDNPRWDYMEFIAFLEALIPLLMLIMQLFSYDVDMEAIYAMTFVLAVAA